VTSNSGSVLNAYTDAAGNEAILYVTRNTSPVKLLPDGDNYTGTGMSLPNKGATNGAFPFVWNGKDYVVYPTLDNYFDGFAVAEPDAAEPLVYVPQTVSVKANEFQADWLNAEVDDQGVTIYQYFPGGHLTVWRLTRQGGVLRGDVNNDGTIDVSDVTALISHVLGTDAGEEINLANAECDLIDGIDIADVTALIARILTGSWQ